ncbi:MAG: phosphodiester glycosidase family protein [Solobacterium sp.]|nr:phosphodiester glycosidase family protein [Solobacterium sp.]
MATRKVKRRKRRLKAGIRRFSRQSLLILLTIGITVAIAGYLAFLIVLKGPSPTFSNYVIGTFMETRRGPAIIRMFFSEEEIAARLSKNQVTYTTEVSTNNDEDFVIPEAEKDNIEILDISGGTYKGKLMIVRDPSRMDLGVNTLMGSEHASGFLVKDYVEAEGAIAGINAGGFDDPNGMGDGSIPYGVVIKDGELVAGELDQWVSLIGFNSHHHLIVGNMTAQEALDWGIQDACTFGPVLLVDGHTVQITGTGGGLNPRTVIGQRADGAVLLLVIDGRQTSSLGASYEDCIKIMLEHGAVNAANLDGGSSSVMVYNGEIINSIVSMRSDRTVPTAWIVK